MKSHRPLWLVILRGFGFWLMIAIATALVVVGYFYSATWMDYNSPLFLFGTLMLLVGVGVLGGGLRYAIVKMMRERSRSSAIMVFLIMRVLFVLLCPYLFRKWTVGLKSEGKVVAIAKRPFLWGDNEFPVYVGRSRIFSLWGDMFDGPWFIYPFADGQRFLCIDDNDTSVLVFVVDLKNSTTNAAGSFGWPPDEYARNYMAETAPKIVIGSKGSVRLPSYEEVQEAAKYVEKLTAAQLEGVSFPAFDLGLYRSYIPKKVLLKELDVNRHSLWPLAD